VFRTNTKTRQCTRQSLPHSLPPSHTISLRRQSYAVRVRVLAMLTRVRHVDCRPVCARTTRFTHGSVSGSCPGAARVVARAPLLVDTAVCRDGGERLLDRDEPLDERECDRVLALCERERAASVLPPPFCSARPA
jgi:hypothetical protein